MVSTRNHPTQFPPPPEDSPTKSSPSKRGRPAGSSKSSTPSSTTSPPSASTRPRARSISTTWSHTPSTVALLWLWISLPLVIWDTGYVLGRPYTMPGGWAHSPIWTPYALYGTVDHFYGWPAIEANDGFTAAQGWMNVVETVMYCVYLWFAYGYGIREPDARGRGAPGGMLGRRKIVGREAGIMVLIGFSAAVMTVAKTILYWLNEACSGFNHVGHNDLMRLVIIWIIPNGAWIVVPSYLIYVFGSEILQGLEIAAGLPYKKEQ